MTSTVATETPETGASTKSLLEVWANNERMRHVPRADWIVRKVDGDLRRRIDIVCSSYEQLIPSDPRHASAEQALTSLCRSLERLADAAKHAHTKPHGGALTARVRDALQHAVTNLRTLDENLFGRRYPFQTLERSKAEPLVGALLTVIYSLDRVVKVLRETDRSIDERLLEGLVTLVEPLRPQPIALAARTDTPETA
jgi:hypothetical protein